MTGRQSELNRDIFNRVDSRGYTLFFLLCSAYVVDVVVVVFETHDGSPVDFVVVVVVAGELPAAVHDGNSGVTSNRVATWLLALVPCSQLLASGR